MLTSGIPELESSKDILYLREKLNLDQPEEIAMEVFRKDFNEAIENSFLTKFNWAFHALNH